MVWKLQLALALLVGCSSNVGVPEFRATVPRALPASGDPLPPESVRVVYKALPWWTLAGTHRHFILRLREAPTARITGNRLGAIRSEDIALSTHDFEAVRCAWKIVPMGDPRPCPELRRTDAKTMSRKAIKRAQSDLRAQAGGAGSKVVGDVCCFASQSLGEPDARLWCEGVAIGVPNAPGSSADTSNRRTGTQIEIEQGTPGTRLVLHVDGSVGMFGRLPVVGTTLGLRYRPFELGLTILDLQRKSIAPMDRGLVGIGATALGRFAIGTSRADVIAGVSAVAVAPNGATNPNVVGLYSAFAGLAYQTPWSLSGVAQPFVQLRAGAAHGKDIVGTAVPFIELHLGLSTPERR